MCSSLLCALASRLRQVPELRSGLMPRWQRTCHLPLQKERAGGEMVEDRMGHNFSALLLQHQPLLRVCQHIS